MNVFQNGPFLSPERLHQYTLRQTRQQSSYMKAPKSYVKSWNGTGIGPGRDTHIVAIFVWKSSQSFLPCHPLTCGQKISIGYISHYHPLFVKSRWLLPTLWHDAWELKDYIHAGNRAPTAQSSFLRKRWSQMLRLKPCMLSRITTKRSIAAFSQYVYSQPYLWYLAYKLGKYDRLRKVTWGTKHEYF